MQSIPREYLEPKETMAKLVSFWAKPTAIKRLDTQCRINRVLRSDVLRLMIDLFLNDIEFQERVLGGLNNG